jgi:hypothetical protein
VQDDVHVFGAWLLVPGFLVPGFWCLAVQLESHEPTKHQKPITKNQLPVISYPLSPGRRRVRL